VNVKWKPYRLHPEAALNAVTPAAPLSGLILYHGEGRGIIQPWPSLGDPPLASLVALLEKHDFSHPLIERALTCAKTEAEAREQSRDLWAGLPEPTNHYTWNDAWPDDQNLALLQSWGCSLVKRKAAPGFGDSQKTFAHFIARHDLRLRLDYNHTLATPEAAALELARLSANFPDSIDWIEDPLPYDPVAWKQLRETSGYQLALDRGLTPEAVEADIFVIKPALHDWQKYRNCGKALVFTSNMDHPIGQRFATWEQARAQQQGVPCLEGGCLTHHLFKETLAIPELVVKNAKLMPPQGPGWGWGDQVW
jgi:o-succinylbenzoate synthase